MLVDVCRPLGEEAMMLLLVAATHQLPLSAAALADVWLATIPLDGRGVCSHALEVCEAVTYALLALDKEEQPRQLVLLVCEGPQSAGKAHLAAKAAEATDTCRERISKLIDARASTAAKRQSVQISHILVSEGGAGCDAAAMDLACMLLRPTDKRHLLKNRPPFGSSHVPARQVVPLLRALHREPDFVDADDSASFSLPHLVGPLPLPQTASEWDALMVCEQAREAAQAAAENQNTKLRQQQEDSALNPSRQFGAQLDELASTCLAQFDDIAAGCEGLAAYSATRLELRRELAAITLRLARAHLALLRRASFDSFCGDLVERMHASRRYAPAARRLRQKYVRAFRKAALLALPTSVDTRAIARRLSHRAVASLEAQLADEVELRRAEGEELEEQCPMPGDDQPAPWYRQVYVQLVGILFNAAQFYLLQYLPAKRRNLANERAVPRGPLF